MRKILLYLLDCVLSNFRSRAALQLEIIVLRHQLEVLQPVLLGLDSRAWTVRGDLAAHPQTVREFQRTDPAGAVH